MAIDPAAKIAHIAAAFAKSKSLLARYVRGSLEAQKRRVEHDREFYRNLEAYCRANNVPPLCEDDWRTGLGSQERR